MTIDRACEILDPEHREHYESIEPVNEACRMAIKALRAQQWISVEDRLPDMCGCKCLVVGANRFGQVDVFTAFTGYMERGKLEFHSCEPTHEIPAWTVTHWRELPQPPEKGE